MMQKDGAGIPLPWEKPASAYCSRKTTLIPSPGSPKIAPWLPFSVLPYPHLQPDWKLKAL